MSAWVHALVLYPLVGLLVGTFTGMAIGSALGGSAYGGFLGVWIGLLTGSVAGFVYGIWRLARGAETQRLERRRAVRAERRARRKVSAHRQT